MPPPAVDVTFLAIRLPHGKLGPMLAVANSILTQTVARVRFHVVADQPPAPLLFVLRKQLGRAEWLTHSTRAAPAGTARLHKKLCARGCNGPLCAIYMHKLLLHAYLPRALRRTIFLDSDVLVRSDVLGLWRIFESFDAQQAIGLAHESNDFHSQEPVTAQGGLSGNGGVRAAPRDAPSTPPRHSGPRAACVPRAACSGRAAPSAPAACQCVH
jgi:hypothetical protein